MMIKPSAIVAANWNATWWCLFISARCARAQFGCLNRFWSSQFRRRFVCCHNIKKSLGAENLSLLECRVPSSSMKRWKIIQWFINNASPMKASIFPRPFSPFSHRANACANNEQQHRPGATCYHFSARDDKRLSREADNGRWDKNGKMMKRFYRRKMGVNGRSAPGVGSGVAVAVNRLSFDQFSLRARVSLQATISVVSTAFCYRKESGDFFMVALSEKSSFACTKSSFNNR